MNEPHITRETYVVPQWHAFQRTWLAGIGILLVLLLVMALAGFGPGQAPQKEDDEAAEHQTEQVAQAQIKPGYDPPRSIARPPGGENLDLRTEQHYRHLGRPSLDRLERAQPVIERVPNPTPDETVRTQTTVPSAGRSYDDWIERAQKRPDADSES